MLSLSTNTPWKDELQSGLIEICKYQWSKTYKRIALDSLLQAYLIVLIKRAVLLITIQYQCQIHHFLAVYISLSVKNRTS